MFDLAKESRLPAVPGMVRVSCVPNCLAPGRRWEGTAPAMRTLSAIKAEVCRMARVPGLWSAGGTMALNGRVIPRDCWDKVTAAPGDSVAFVAAPAGKVGNALLKVVGAVAMIVGAAMTGGATILGMSGFWLGMGIAAGGMALSMAADFICPMPLPSIGGGGDSKSASPTYSLNSSSNNMRYGQPIPRIYGRYKVPPVRILDDFTELRGQEEFLNFLSVIGYGPLDISDIRIGGNPLSNFSGVEVQVTGGWSAGENTSLTPTVVYQTAYQVELTSRDSYGNATDPATWWVMRSIDHDVDYVSFDVQAPQGLFQMDDNANRTARSAVVQAQFRQAGGAWSGMYEFALHGIAAQPATSVRSSFGWSLPRGKYDVRVRRRDAEDASSKVVEKLYFTALRGQDHSTATDSGKLPLAKLAMRIKASNQLSGSLPVVTCVATSVLRDWDGSSWVLRATRNPASAFLDILTGTANERRKGDDQIDWPSLQAWHEWCTRYGYTCDLVFDQQTSVWDALADVASVGRGSAALMGGLWGAVWARRQDGAPKGHITARNSRGFSSRKTYREPIHGLHVTFFDADNDYEETVIDVYAPGYNRNNASLFEGIDLLGVTNRRQAAYMGQFRLNQLLYLPEEYEATMPLEYMRLQKNDKVRVVRPEVLYGIGAAMLVDWEENVAGSVTSLRWDSPLPMDAGRQYMAVVRQSDGSEWPVLGRSEDGLVFTLDVPQSPEAPLKAMALVMVGVAREVGRECIVTSVKPSSNLTATVTLQDYVPQLYENDGGAVPPYYAHTTLPGNAGRALKVPTITLLRSDEWALDVRPSGLVPRLYAAWQYNDDSTYARVEYRRVEAGIPGDWMIAGTVEGSSIFIPDVDEGWKLSGTALVPSGVSYDVRVQAVNPATGRVSAWAEATGHRVVGRTSRPPQVEGLTLAIQDPEGIRAEWTAVQVRDFAHYAIEGAVKAESSVPSAMLKPYGKAGVLSQKVYAVDVLGLRSETALEASLEVLPPAAPVPVYEVLPQAGAEVRWPDCKTTWSISHYTVEDLWEGSSASYADPRFSVSPRPLGRAYRFVIRAVDVFGNAGPATETAISIGAMPATAPAAGVDGTQVVVSWQAIAAPFAIEWYEVQDANGQLIGKVKGTELRFEAPAAGSHGWRVRGVDIAGNIGLWGECSLVLGLPSAPRVSAALAEDGTMVELSWTAPASQLPLRAYDVVRQWSVTRPDGLMETLEEDYGRHDALALSVLPLSAGTHTFLVRAVDSAGNTGPWGTADFVAAAPGRVTFFDVGAVDNSVMIYYTDPNRIFFKIREYLVEEMQDGYGAEIGRTDTHFFSDIKSKGGVYSYGVTPVDVAGNLGQRAVISLNVSDPPDFIIFTEQESLFNGERVNMVLDGAGDMIGPIPDGETWQQNAARVAALIGGTEEGVTWQAKADGGYGRWLSPAVAEGSYTEVIDAGTLIPSTKITVDVTQEALEGAPVMTCRIEVSEDGADWREVTDNGTTAFATSFRYVRFSFRWTGGLVAVSRIFYSLNVKRKTDFGRALCRAEDEGGTEISFNVGFIEVQSLPRPNVVNDATEGGLTAFTDFDGGLNPTSFRCFVRNREGQRVTATVDWLAGGV